MLAFISLHVSWALKEQTYCTVLHVRMVCNVQVRLIQLHKFVQRQADLFGGALGLNINFSDALVSLSHRCQCHCSALLCFAPN